MIINRLTLRRSVNSFSSFGRLASSGNLELRKSKMMFAGWREAVSNARLIVCALGLWGASSPSWVRPCGCLGCAHLCDAEEEWARRQTIVALRTPRLDISCCWRITPLAIIRSCFFMNYALVSHAKFKPNPMQCKNNPRCSLKTIRWELR